MSKSLYSVKDTVRGVFNPPFVEHNDETAVRAFNFSCKESPFRLDLALYKLADFDEDTGKITLFEDVKFLTYFSEVVEDAKQ